MSGLRRLERFAPLLGLLVGAAILLVGLGRHGIWDPTELAFAESLTGSNRPEGMPWLHGSLVRAGFELFGRRDFSGRVFGAAATWIASAAALVLARRHLDGRAAAYASVMAAATPLAVLNARWMVGDGAAIGLHALVGLGLFVAAFERTRDESITPTHPAIRVAGLAIAIAASFAVTWFRGALIGVMPPLLAIAGVALIEPVRSVAGRIRTALAAIAFGFAGVLAFLIVRDADSFSLLLGGVPSGEAPPSFERFLQVAFHSLAPVSPVFVVAAARAVRPTGTDEIDVERQRVSIALVLWAVFAFGATTLFASRYGHPTFLAIVPVAVLAAFTLREAETTRTLDLTSLLVFGMLLGLLLRDYALYPASPLAGIPVTAPTLAADFQPRAIWAALFLAFGGTVGFAGASHLVDGRDFRTTIAPLRRAYEWLTTAPAGIGTSVAIGVVAIALFVLGAFGESVFHLPSIAPRIARPAAVAILIGPPIAAFLVLATLYLFARLGGGRMIPAVVVIAAIGAYVQGPFLVELSGDLSPRDLFATFNELRGQGESLAQFDVRSRSVDYYVDGPTIEIRSRADLVERLSARGGPRRWIIFRRALLAQVDRDVRTRTGHHVYLAHGTNEEFVLAVDRPIPNRADQNPLADSVIPAARARPEHPLDVRFRDVDLIGYDLALPNGDSVGAGQPILITWYWRSRVRTSTDWRVFVHIDGAGLRLNGDHDPVEGLLPTSQWNVGDIIRDRQELDVPASYPSHDFRIHIGLFSGNDRMPLVSGPDAGENRAIAGTLRVR